jgi:hypothetical protein
MHLAGGRFETRSRFGFEAAIPEGDTWTKPPDSGKARRAPGFCVRSALGGESVPAFPHDAQEHPPAKSAQPDTAHPDDSLDPSPAWWLCSDRTARTAWVPTVVGMNGRWVKISDEGHRAFPDLIASGRAL